MFEIFSSSVFCERRARRCSQSISSSFWSWLKHEKTKDSFFGLLARGRLGYRHIFGPSLGVEVAFDAAQPFFAAGSAVTQAVGTSTLWQTTVMGGYAGLMLGF